MLWVRLDWSRQVRRRDQRPSLLTCRFPNLGPFLYENGVPLLDCVGEEIFTLLQDGDLVEIEGRKVLKNGR